MGNASRHCFVVVLQPTRSLCCRTWSVFHAIVPPPTTHTANRSVFVRSLSFSRPFFFYSLPTALFCNNRRSRSRSTDHRVVEYFTVFVTAASILQVCMCLSIVTRSHYVHYDGKWRRMIIGFFVLSTAIVNDRLLCNANFKLLTTLFFFCTCVFIT